MKEKQVAAQLYKGRDAVIKRGHHGLLCILCGAHEKEVNAFVQGYWQGLGVPICDGCIRELHGTLPVKFRRGPTF